MNKPGRHYFLDWVRIIAFFILILYHTGMYYVTWDWHVKSPFASGLLEPFMWLSSPWRLGLLFFISGVASAFMLGRTRAGAFVRQRSWRLLLPLAFGMLVIVPLQPYYEVIEKLGYDGSYVDFMQLYLTGYDGFCREDCLILPTWNHLWFVAYLWVYSALLGIAALAGVDRIERCGGRVARLLTGWRAVVLPVAVLAIARILLKARFESTHALVDDFHNHAIYLSLFAAGVLLARQERFWQTLRSLRWHAFAIALGCWAYLVWYHELVDHEAHNVLLMDFLRPTERILFALCQWCAIVAACGFAHRHLNQDSPARRYLTLAVFPVYILHQTLTVTLAHNMKPLLLAPAVEGPILLTLTLVLSFAGYEAVRRIALLRPFFGLGASAAPVIGAGAAVTRPAGSQVP